MAITSAIFSSATDEWATPQWLYDELNAWFGFTLDPCALPTNAKCDKFYTPQEDGLLQDWGGERVFCNPPYGRAISAWIKKCAQESKKPNTIIVALLPARVDTKWFHEYVYHKARYIRFIQGRLKFGDSKNSAPFPSMIVVF